MCSYGRLLLVKGVVVCMGDDLAQERRMQLWLLISFVVIILGAALTFLDLDIKWSVGWGLVALGLCFATALWLVSYQGRLRFAREMDMLQSRLPVRRNLAEDLRKVQERYALVVEGTNDGIWDWDIVQGKVQWTQRSAEILGVSAKVLGDDFAVFKDLLEVEDKKRFAEAMEACQRNSQLLNLEIKVRRPSPKGEKAGSINRHFRHLLLRGKVQFSEKEIPLRMAGSISDVTDLKLAEEKRLFLSLNDELTGLYSRKTFLKHLDEELQRARRRQGAILGVITVDMDKFKAINDAHGHQIGDEILKQVAARIQLSCRQGDRVARIGGDEFGILLVDLAQAQDAMMVTSRILMELKEPVEVGVLRIQVHASLGLALNEEHGLTSETMLANADTVLQQSKARGGGRCEVFTHGMREKALESYRMESELRNAMEKENFFLVYQPIIRLSDMKVVGFEALVRWNRNSEDVVSPSEFIPMAESTGLILPMGAWILQESCRQMKAWLQLDSVRYRDITVAVNFSARQFQESDLVSNISRELSYHQVSPRNLKVEITETVAMTEVERTIRILQGLADRGLKISIDDFGTGYSSLGYLKRYPVDTLKIDRSFIKDLPVDLEDVAITRAIIAMGKSLNKKLIAEGAETQQQVEFLKAEGCDMVQGFFFSKPLTATDATAFLEKYAPTSS